MIYTASIVGLAKTLLWIFLFYFAFKILARLFAPFLMRFAAKKMEQRFGQQFGGSQNQAKPKPKHKEGETIIDKVPNEKKASNNSVGEYIDYEEVD
jgi:hypothetical protein